MGYSEHQRQELEETIHRTNCDLVLVATPVNLGLILNIDKPFVRVGYEVEEMGQPRLTDLLDNFLEKQSHPRMAEKVTTH